MRANSNGDVVKRTPRGAYDWLYVLTGDGGEFLVTEDLTGRRQFTPTPEHALGAVAESGRLQLP